MSKEKKKVQSNCKRAFVIEATELDRRVDAATKKGNKPTAIIKNLNNFWRRGAEKVFSFPRRYVFAQHIRQFFLLFFSFYQSF